MARPVTGFLTIDGSFFPTQERADAYDQVQLTAKALIVRRDALTSMCESHNVKPTAFINYVEAMAAEVQGYLGAIHDHTQAVAWETETIRNESEDHPTESPVTSDRDQSDDEDGSDDLTAVVEQPTRGRQSMPDVGDRTR